MFCPHIVIFSIVERILEVTLPLANYLRPRGVSFVSFEGGIFLSLAEKREYNTMNTLDWQI